MLKFIFLLLLSANAALFAYSEGYLETLFPSGREPARMSRQMNADKIKLLSANAASALVAAHASTPAVASPAPATPAAEATSPAAAAPNAAAPAATTPRKPLKVIAACTEIGNFNADEARKFRQLLAPLALGERLSRHKVHDVVSHMVYIPPQGDKEGAEKKANELRHLGINDFFIIQDNSDMRWGISLGVFKTEEGARQHLLALGTKGVRTARIGQRVLNVTATAFRLTDVDADTMAALREAKASFPKQEIRDCGTAL